ncbi:MAG TPA: RNase adapter RapZ, partial [Sulfuricaulis sp.]|nr:RNase adapter RapZ [Sulfuricaulis sp.]
VEAIRAEKQLLEPLSFDASLRIDTTRTTPHELRSQVRNFARGEDTAGLTLLFESFGYKHGTPLDADYVFDVRCLPNPYWQTELRQYTGLDDPVVRFLDKHDDVQEMFNEIRGFLEKWLPHFEREDRTYLTIAVGCTGGQHRSVYLVHRLAQHFANKGLKTQVRHRELK